MLRWIVNMFRRPPRAQGIPHPEYLMVHVLNAGGRSALR